VILILPGYFLISWKIENRLILLIFFIKRTDSAKVFSREGNSPDYLLKFLNTEVKELVLYMVVGGRIGSSHPFKKA